MNSSSSFLVVFLVLYISTIYVQAQYNEEFDYDTYGSGASRAASPYSTYSNENPRTVTDLEVIYGSQGVPIDESYNEPKSGDTYSSSPGCPKSIDNHPWVLYEVDIENKKVKRCFLAGTQGPCKFGQKILGDVNSDIGECVCQCVYDNKQGFLEVMVPNTPERFLVCANTSTEAAYEGQVYDTKKKECYRVYTKGHCEEGKVIEGWSDTEVRCRKPCNQNESDWEEKAKKHKCSKGPDPNAAPKLGYKAEESQDDCPAWKTYSEILRKCIKKRKPSKPNTVSNVKIILKRKK